MLEIGVVVRVKLSVALAADFANRFILAGCRAAGVGVLNGNRLFGGESKAVCRLCTHSDLKAVFFCRISMGRNYTAVHTVAERRRQRTVAKADKFIPVGCVGGPLRQSKAEFVILGPANLVSTADINGRNILFRSFVIAELALLPILAVFALPFQGMPVVDGDCKFRGVTGGVRHNHFLPALCRCKGKSAVLALQRRTVYSHRHSTVIVCSGKFHCPAIHLAVYQPINHRSGNITPVGRIASVACTALRHQHCQIRRAGQICTAPACKGIAVPLRISQGKAVALYGILVRVAGNGAPGQVILYTVGHSLPHRVKG